MRIIRITVVMLLFSIFLSAQEGYSVDPYTFGITIGGSGALTDSLKSDDKTQLFTVAVTNSWALNNYVAVPLDIEWYSLTNFALFTGLEMSVGSKQIRPLLGANVGLAYMNKGGFGPALKAQLGIQLNLTRTFGLKIKAPYRIVFNDNKDQMVGAEVTFIWYNKF